MAKRSHLLLGVSGFYGLLIPGLFPLSTLAGDADNTVDQAALDRAYEKLRAKQHAAPTTASATSQPASPHHPATLRADAPPAIKQLWNNRERFRAERLTQLAADEKSARQSAGQSIRSKDLQEATASQKRIKDIQQEEVRVRSAAFVLPLPSGSRFDLSKFKEGYVGLPPTLGVKQVIDDTTLLAAVIDPSEFFTSTEFDRNNIAPGDATAPTLSEAYDRAASKAIGQSRVVVWIHDYDTHGLVDGKHLRVPLDSIISVDGTTRYDTTDGSPSTVLKARLVKIDDFLQ